MCTSNDTNITYETDTTKYYIDKKMLQCWISFLSSTENTEVFEIIHFRPGTIALMLWEVVSYNLVYKIVRLMQGCLE